MSITDVQTPDYELPPEAVGSSIILRKLGNIAGRVWPRLIGDLPQKSWACAEFHCKNQNSLYNRVLCGDGAHVPTKVVERVIRLHQDWLRDYIPIHNNKEHFMKRYILILAALTALSSIAWAQDGAALYKSKCAMCHGAMGEGKVGPSLQKTSLSAAQITDLLTNGAAGKKAPHTKGISGLSADQASSLATYVSSLKK
jgi:cytochrome c553